MAIIHAKLTEWNNISTWGVEIKNVKKWLLMMKEIKKIKLKNF